MHTHAKLLSILALGRARAWKVLSEEEFNFDRNQNFDRLLLDPGTNEISFDLNIQEENFQIVQEFSVDRVTNIDFPIVVEKGDVVPIQYFQDNILRELFKNTTSHLYDSIIAHGCHCARFNKDLDQTILGGSQVISDMDGVDDKGLDRLCKDWIGCKACNKSPGGSCFDNVNEKEAYHVDIKQFDDWECKDTENCLLDSCVIDTDYARKIYEVVIDNIDVNLFVQAEAGDCSAPGGTGGTGQPGLNVDDGFGINARFCTGTVPDIFLQVGSPPPVVSWTNSG